MPPELMDGRTLARRLNRRYSDVLVWARRGFIPSIKTSSGAVVFDLDQVVKALMRDKAEASA